MLEEAKGTLKPQYPPFSQCLTFPYCDFRSKKSVVFGWPEFFCELLLPAKNLPCLHFGASENQNVKFQPDVGATAVAIPGCPLVGKFCPHLSQPVSPRRPRLVEPGCGLGCSSGAPHYRTGLHEAPAEDPTLVLAPGREFFVASSAVGVLCLSRRSSMQHRKAVLPGSLESSCFAQVIARSLVALPTCTCPTASSRTRGCYQTKALAAWLGPVATLVVL